MMKLGIYLSSTTAGLGSVQTLACTERHDAERKLIVDKGSAQPQSPIHCFIGEMECIQRIIFIFLVASTTCTSAEECQNVKKPDQRSCTYRFQNITIFEIKNLRRANEIICELEGNLSNLRYISTHG